MSSAVPRLGGQSSSRRRNVPLIADVSPSASEQTSHSSTQSAVETVGAEIFPGLAGGLPGWASLKVELALLSPDSEFSAGSHRTAGVHSKI